MAGRRKPRKRRVSRQEELPIMVVVLRVILIAAVTLLITSGIGLVSDRYPDSQVFIFSLATIIVVAIIGITTGRADLTALQRLGITR